MSTELIISAAINIAIAVAINVLFPPPNTRQEGPRLTDLDLSSASYGRPTNVLFGTDRVSGNIIWGEPIEEVRNEESSGGKGKGGKATSITYTYFATFAIAFAIAGADDILRIWADGKLIMDKTGMADSVKAGVNFTIYHGGATQQKDPLEVSFNGDEDTPAYRHLTRIVFNRLPLADFGNRIPSLTAEVTFNGTKSWPFVGLKEVAGQTLGTLGKMAVDSRTNSFFGLSQQLGVESYRADRTTGNVKAITTGLAPLLTTGYGWDILLSSDGANNNTFVHKVSAITGKLIETSTFSFINGVGGYFIVHKVGSDQIGDMLIGIKGGNSIVGNTFYIFTAEDSGKVVGDDGTLQNSGDMFFNPDIGLITPALDTPITNEINIAISDDERGSDSQNIYVISVNGLQTRVAKIAFTLDLSSSSSVAGSIPGFSTMITLMAIAGLIVGGLTALTGSEVQVTEPRVGVTFDISTLSDFTFPSGGAVPTGWAVDSSTGRLLISNGTSSVLYDPDIKSVIITSEEIGFDGWNNYVSGGIFGYVQGNSTTGELVLINIADLTVISRTPILDLDLTPIGGDNNHVDDTTSVWDDDGQAVVFSRVGGGSSAPNERVVRVLVNRGTGGSVTLTSVVSSLLTDYHGIPMGGLEPADFDLIPLAGLDVEGYNIDRQSTVRQALEPLRKAYFFDVVQSDWILKTPVRGGASVLTIPADQVGQANFNAGGSNNPVTEIRAQEVELPMRLNVRYTSRQADYDNDVEHAKRLVKPVPSMLSSNEKTIDLPIVFADGTIPKRVAEKWLFTLWNERITYKTIIPWTYLKLDPTDVFNMDVFGETVRLRMAEQDIGLGLSTDITAVKEAAYTFSSIVASSSIAGLPGQVVPSRSPTKLIFLDAPLLLPADLNQGESSAAYAAMGSYTPNWPGAAVYASKDGVTFARQAVSNAEMAWGVVTVGPSAWGADNDCGDFPNRFQEVAEGGTITVAIQRRLIAFSSATELNILNGANMIAVVLVGGSVEVIQFQDVSVPDPDFPDTLLLSRLLRGRLGTEDRAIAGGPVNGNEMVLLAGETPEGAAVFKMNVPFADLGQSLTYKPSTLGTELESAIKQRFIYKGRDLRPYKLAHIVTSFVADPTNPDEIAQLVMNFEGIDGSTSGLGFDNIGTEGSQPTEIVGTAQIDTAQRPAGGNSVSSLLLDGNSDYLRWTDRAEWALGTGPVTISCHFRPNATGLQHILASQYNSTGNQRGWILFIDASNHLAFNVYRTGVTLDRNLTGTTALSAGVDYHAAAVRKNNGDWVLFLDGVIESGPTTPTSNPFNSTADLLLGAINSGGITQFFNGWIDSFELLIGAAKWEAAFTPPTGNIVTDSTLLDVSWERRTRLNGGWLDGVGDVPLNETLERYIAVLANEIGTDTSLLMNFEGLDDSVSAIDHSTHSHVLTYGAGAKVSTEQQKFGLASLELSGAGADPSTSNIEIADDATFEFGAGQFTIECFVRFSNLLDIKQVIISKYLNTGDQRSWVLERNGDSLRFLYSTDGSALTTLIGTFTFLVDTWYHVAVDRDSSDDIRLYVDGAVVGGPTAAAVTFFGGTAEVNIGKFRSVGFDDFAMTGFVDDLRVLKGRTAYGGAFTPRTDTLPVGLGFAVKDVSNAKTVSFTAAEQALGQGEQLRVDVRQVSGTGLLSPVARCLVT